MPPVLEKEAATIPRDGRLDEIGVVKELARHFDKEVIPAVKGRMAERGQELAEADVFQGLLATGTTETIDPDKFLALFEAGTLTREQFVQCISVRKGSREDPGASRYLSGAQISAISRKTKNTPALTVTRIKGVEAKLLETVEQLGARALAKLTLSLRGK